jgi:hypothetical protein
VSREKLRYFANEIFTIKELAFGIDAKPHSIWLFRQGVDRALSASEIRRAESLVREKLAQFDNVLAGTAA